jgi:uncharacterized protein (DUF4415 family)
MTENKRVTRSDLKKFDAYVNTKEDYDETPELDDDFFEHADFHVGGKLIQRGRPRSETPKQQITLRLDAEVIERFRQGGAGWQSRINAALRASLGLKPAKP